jgi:DNA-directed RNA polymerase specialized sigma24 family protein
MTTPGDQQSTATTEERSVRCSFCLKSPETVGQLIEGRDVPAYICRDCVELCMMVFQHQSWKRCAEQGPDQRAINGATRELLTERIDQSLSDLTHLEREVIKLRYGLSVGYICTYEELARRFEITPARAEEVEREAVEKLRSPRA